MTKRQPKGIPVGGEFAANEHDEAAFGLGGDEGYGFWEGPNDPAIIGTDPAAYRKAISYVGADRVEMVHPTRAQTAKSLDDADGKKSAGAVRGVAIDGMNSGTYEVSAPRDGAPLVVLSQAGENTLRVKSGRVVIVGGDRFTTTKVQVDSGAEVVFLSGDASSISAVANEGAKITVVAYPGARGSVSGKGIAHVVQPEHVEHSIDNQTTDGFLPKGSETPF